MENQRTVSCRENEDLASFMWKKRQEMAESSGMSDRIDSTLYKAYRSVCDSKTHIKTMKDFSQIKGVGKWTLRLLQGFFSSELDTSGSDGSTKKGKKTKGPKRYVPQKNSVSYALLITLYRGTANGSSFMRKQELIDAAEASGLSRISIAPETGKAKPGQFCSSPRDWYSGWSCMKTLITKGLVVKSSCPAKYMLTQEGKEAASECLLRSGLVNSAEPMTKTNGFASCVGSQNSSDLGFARPDSSNKEAALPSNEHLRKDQVDTLHSESLKIQGRDGVAKSTICTFTTIGKAHSFIEGHTRKKITSNAPQHDLDSSSSDATLRSFTFQACTSSDYPAYTSLNADDLESTMIALAMPPRELGEKFEDVYDVILILDDREQFGSSNHGSRSRKVIESIRTQFNIQVEVRRLPVGDGIWIARHKHLDDEYVLDFIVERKKVDDLCSSIKDNRYRDQKLRLLRCGLRKLIYLVEGDPNSCEAAESIKTACFTTEILEGFDIQRTSGLTDTLRKYGYLTQSINHYYRTQFSNDKNDNNGICHSFVEFIKKCEDLEKMTVSDIFAVQLMQVPQVTEEIALAVLDLHPTLLSLAHAYSLLEGDVGAQEEMLKKQSNLIPGGASRNIFKLVWGC